MNDASSPGESRPLSPPPFPPRVPSGTDWHGLFRRLLVCNPFFLCSAALLLFGLNRLSVDPSFLEREESKLLFNFTALQIYQFLVVGTALVLARRRLWYDSALLVVVENGLALVPFMLVSQAAMIDGTLGVLFIAIGVFLCGARFAAIKRGYPSFNLPWGLAFIGAAVLAINAALPLRLQSVVRVSTVYEWEPYNAAFWQYVLPVLIASVNLLQRPKRYGGLNQERHWLPLFLAGLWITATALHGWSCAYVGKQTVSAPMLALAAVVIGWTFWNRLTDFVESPSNALQAVALLAPLGAPWLAVGNPALFAALMALNTVAYALIWYRSPALRDLVLPAMGMAGLLCVSGLPMEIVTAVMPVATREKWIAIVFGGAIWIASLTKFTPLRGTLGGICAGMGVSLVAGADTNLSFQAGSLFVVLHSLLWKDRPETGGAETLRNATLATWVLAAIFRSASSEPNPALMQVCGAVILGFAWWLVWRTRPARFLLQLPSAAGVTALWPAGVWIVQNGSAGILALAGSLILFASGCALAWTRSRWER